MNNKEVTEQMTDLFALDILTLAKGKEEVTEQMTDLFVFCEI